MRPSTRCGPSTQRHIYDGFQGTTAVHRLATGNSKRGDRLWMATLPDRYFVMRVGRGFKALRPGLRQESIWQMPVVAVYSTRSIQEEQGRNFW